jgi:acetylornithine deacetylase
MRREVKATGAYAAFPDPVPVQVLGVESGSLAPDAPLSVPSRAALRVYFQFLPEEDVDAAIASIRRHLDDFCAADPFFSQHQVQWKPVIGGPLFGHELAADHPWTRCMAASAEAVLRRPPVVTAAPYPCDAGLMQRDFAIPTLLFGPSGGGAHNADEYVEFDSVMRTAEVLLAATLAWCG